MYEVGHIAMNTDDVDATRAFYESVCGWRFQAWGPPGFHRAELPGGFTVAIQQRRELIPNTPTIGAEPTVTVDDIAACLERAETAGGDVLMPPTEIPGVGTVAFVADPGGNPIGFMQHQ
jgi:predicted enzyme related to lactoylglutathione lyase